MLKLLATLGTLAMAQTQCCPASDCPPTATRVCCSKCPTTCLGPPEQMLPLQLTKVNCLSTQLSWQSPKSCAPILFSEIQCIGNNGSY